VIRSRNAPAGDLAETLVAQAYDGTLGPKSGRSWEVLAGRRRLQVKSRVVDTGEKRTQLFSPFRSWDFDACVFVLFDSVTYDVIRALEIEVANVDAASHAVAWVAGALVSVTQVLAYPQRPT
jgi:hypothetical protein